MPAAAISIPGFRYSLEAAADLSSSQYRGVVVDSSGQVALAGLNGNLAGVLQNKPAAQGRAAEIYQTGITKAVLGGTVAAGAQVSTDANGRFVTTPATVGAVPVGVCIVGGAVDEIGSVLLYGAPGSINAGT